MPLDSLFALAPVDGRYEKTCEPLQDFLSEFALIKNRLTVMVHYVIMIALYPQVASHPLSDEERSKLLTLAGTLSLKQAAEIKAIEATGTKRHKKTNHDVKACELFLRDFMLDNRMEEFVELVHVGRTSEDVNNIAYAMMLRGAIHQVIRPALQDVGNEINDFALRYASLPMLSRTHGQPATPTTLGKEFAVFRERLSRQDRQLAEYRITIKLNGASGNYAADMVAYPDVDWINFSQTFCARLSTIGRGGFEPNLTTTQIEAHDTYAELFAILARINTILIGFAQDMWSYVSEDWLVQKPVAGEVGSSTMPHKVNPIDFENAEGNFGVANALFGFFAQKLPISRRQRDLSDSTVERCFGMALGHTLIGYKSLVRGLKKISANENKIREDLAAHPEVITEAYQSILRSIGYPEGYNLLKDVSRGKKVTLRILYKFIDDLDPEKVSQEVKARMRAIMPETYTGLAERIAQGGLD